MRLPYWKTTYSQATLNAYLLQMAAAHEFHSRTPGAGVSSLRNLTKYRILPFQPKENDLKGTALPKHLVRSLTSKERSELNNMARIAASYHDLRTAAWFLNSTDSNGDKALLALVKEAQSKKRTPEEHKEYQHRAAAFVYWGASAEAEDPKGEVAAAKRELAQANSDLTRLQKANQATRPKFDRLRPEQNPRGIPQDEKNLQNRASALLDNLTKLESLYMSADQSAVFSKANVHWSPAESDALKFAIKHAVWNRKDILDNKPPGKPGW